MTLKRENRSNNSFPRHICHLRLVLASRGCQMWCKFRLRVQKAGGSKCFRVEFLNSSLKQWKLYRSRKRKNSTSSLNNSTLNGTLIEEVKKSEIIALGTSSGTVLIYSTKTGDVSATLKDENGAINAVVSQIHSLFDLESLILVLSSGMEQIWSGCFHRFRSRFCVTVQRQKRTERGAVPCERE